MIGGALKETGTNSNYLFGRLCATPSLQTVRDFGAQFQRRERSAALNWNLHKCQL